MGKLCLKGELSYPVRLRLFFEECGGGLIKFGQVLSLRHDFLSDEYTNELLNLLAKVPAKSFPEMEKVFLSEMGVLPKQFFREFDPAPLASASIGQVYKAVMKDGSRVAIKIQRPGVKELFETDFIVLTVLASVIDLLPYFQAIGLRAVVKEFTKWSRRELDFRNEGRAAEKFYRASQNETDVIIPRVYLEYIKARVLIMELKEDFFLVEEIMRRVKVDIFFTIELKEKFGIDTEALVRRFILEEMRQYFVNGFFHADPHPANIFFAPGNKLGFFDYGIVGVATSKRLSFIRAIHAITTGDLYLASKYFLTFAKKNFEKELAIFKAQGERIEEKYEKVLEKIEDIMVDNFRLDLEEILAPWYKEKGKNTMLVVPRIIWAVRKYHVHLPSEIVLFFRTLAIADMVALRLTPTFDMIATLRNFFEIHPLPELEKIVAEEEHAPEEDSEEIEIYQNLSYEALIEKKERNKEVLEIARERLTNLILSYAENYDEVRQLLVSS